MLRVSSATILLAVLAATWLAFGHGANAMEITITPGKQARPAGPMCWKPAEPLDPKAAYCLAAEGRPATTAQLDAEGRLWWWAAPMKPGETIMYEVQIRPAAEARDRVKVEQVKDGVIDVTIDGKPFTTFHFDKESPKPYLYPVLGPTGDPVTRDYPMKYNPLEKNPGQGIKSRQDHPHHRSLWTAHGDVRTKDFSKPGSNYWNEVKEKGSTAMAATRKGNDVEDVKRIARMVSGPVFGQIEAEIDWITKDGRRELTEDRTYTFFRGDDDSRVIDTKNVFKFPDGDVMFADTKEGGIIALRLAVTMDEIGATVDGKKVHGQMCNSNGGVGAKQCWGKAADWCDYVGPVDGKTVGVAVMDNPKNFRHPETWHIREYGLYTANPFGLKEFTGDKSKDGSKIWKKGETVEFNYRILLHKGDTKAADVPEAYRMYVAPPKVEAR
jgi:hypothetical protein